MARSIKKGPFVDQYLIDKVEKMGNQKAAIKTWSRRSMIIPDFVGHTFNVHNGKSFVPVFVTENINNSRRSFEDSPQLVEPIAGFLFLSASSGLNTGKSVLFFNMLRKVHHQRGDEPWKNLMFV